MICSEKCFGRASMQAFISIIHSQMAESWGETWLINSCESIFEPSASMAMTSASLKNSYEESHFLRGLPSGVYQPSFPEQGGSLRRPRCKAQMGGERDGND